MEKILLEKEGLMLYSAVMNHPQFARDIRVIILKKKAQRHLSHVILYSTNVNLSPLKIYQYYNVRF